MNHVLRPGTKRPIGYNRENDVRLLERFLSRRNTTRSAAKMSRRLIEHFGDIASAIRAEPAELAPLAGPQTDLAGDFRHLRELLESIARSAISDRPLLDDLESVQRYCQVLLGGERREQIEKVMYRAFTQLLGASANYTAARAATIQAARDLYPTNTAVVNAITQAWIAVGVN